MRRGLEGECRFTTTLDIFQCEGGSKMEYNMPFHPVLETFGGNLIMWGTGAGTADEHAPYFPDNLGAKTQQI